MYKFDSPCGRLVSSHLPYPCRVVAGGWTLEWTCIRQRPYCRSAPIPIQESRTESERWPTAALRRHAALRRDRSASQHVLASRRGAHLFLPKKKKKTRQRARRPHGRAVDARHRPVRHVTAPQRPMALTRPCHTPRLTRADPARSPVLPRPGLPDETTNGEWMAPSYRSLSWPLTGGFTHDTDTRVPAPRTRQLNFKPQLR